MRSTGEAWWASEAWGASLRFCSPRGAVSSEVLRDSPKGKDDPVCPSLSTAAPPRFAVALTARAEPCVSPLTVTYVAARTSSKPCRPTLARSPRFNNLCGASKAFFPSLCARTDAESDSCPRAIDPRCGDCSSSVVVTAVKGSPIGRDVKRLNTWRCSSASICGVQKPQRRDTLTEVLHMGDTNLSGERTRIVGCGAPSSVRTFAGGSRAGT
jgi:hypothetical protein